MVPAINDPYEQTTADPAEARGEDAAAGVRGQARGAVEDLKEQARGAAGEARERVRATANRQKDAAAEQVSGVASALRSAADDLNRREQRFSAGWFEQVAEGLERVSAAMRSRDLTEFVESVEEFARRQPVAFLGGTVVAGLALGRFMKSSAARRGPSGGDRATPGGGA